jgi:alpha-L-rhamnosidase
MKRRWIYGAACVALWIDAGLTAGAQVPTVHGPVELRVENLKTPLGIDDPTPRLSWQLSDSARGARQTAYQVLVASKPFAADESKTDVWDSGRIKSDQSLNVCYQGPALAPSTRHFWRVRVWDAQARFTPTANWAGGKRAS